MRKRNKHLRRLLIALAVIAMLAGSLTIYGYIARQDPQRIIENRIVKLDKAECIDLPAVRFIGMEAQRHDWPPDAIQAEDELWERHDEFIPILDAMTEYTTENTDICILEHCYNYAWDDPDYKDQQLLGKFMKAGTPVPEGFGYVDIPATKIVLATYKGEWEAVMDKGPGMMWGKFDIPYPEGFFFARVFREETVMEEGTLTKMTFINPVD